MTSQHPAGRPGPGPDLLRIDRQPGAAQQHRPRPARPSASATPATGSPSTTSTRAWPGPRPAVVLALTAAATSTIRLGSGRGADGAPHRPVHRRGVRPARRACTRAASTSAWAGPAARPREPKAPALAGGGAAATVVNGRTPSGLLIPPRFSFKRLLDSPRFALQKTLLQLPHAEPQNYTEQVADVLALIAGTYRSPDGEEAHVVPGEGAALQVWILGSSGGESAEVAGQQRPAVRCQLPRQPGHRAGGGGRLPGRVPAVRRARPPLRQRVGRRRRRRHRGRGPRAGHRLRPVGAQHPHRPRALSRSRPPSRPAAPWTDADRELVADRIDTQFVGTPGQVADQLEQLRDATEADELIITTITHDHADRVRSFRLLAEEWARR